MPEKTLKVRFPVPQELSGKTNKGLLECYDEVVHQIDARHRELGGTGFVRIQPVHPPVLTTPSGLLWIVELKLKDESEKSLQALDLLDNEMAMGRRPPPLPFGETKLQWDWAIEGVTGRARNLSV